jgi:hypothetical protein
MHRKLLFSPFTNAQIAPETSNDDWVRENNVTRLMIRPTT